MQKLLPFLVILYLLKYIHYIFANIDQYFYKKDHKFSYKCELNKTELQCVWEIYVYITKCPHNVIKKPAILTLNGPPFQSPQRKTHFYKSLLVELKKKKKKNIKSFVFCLVNCGYG